MLLQTRVKSWVVAVASVIGLAALVFSPNVSDGQSTAKQSNGTHTENGKPKLVESDTEFSAGRIELDEFMLAVFMQASCSADALQLNAVIVNHSDYKVTVGETGYFLDCNVRIVDKNGQRIAHNRLGAYLWDRRNWHGGRGGQYGEITTQAGEGHYWTINLNKTLDSMEPGEYELSLETTVQFRDTVTRRQLKTARMAVKGVPFVVKDGEK